MLLMACLIAGKVDSPVLLSDAIFSYVKVPRQDENGNTVETTKLLQKSQKNKIKKSNSWDNIMKCLYISLLASVFLTSEMTPLWPC